MRSPAFALPAVAPPRITLRHCGRVAFAIAALFVALLLHPATARAATYWVGNNGNPPCTHANLQAALDAAVASPGFDVIYLVGGGPFEGPFSMFGTDVEIFGNVGSCGSEVSVGFASIIAAPSFRPLTIVSTGDGTVRLRHVGVRHQPEGTFHGNGGGISFVGGSPASRLELVHSEASSNTASGLGGGIFVSQGRLVLEEGSHVFFNNADSGGGIVATGGAVVEVRNSVMNANTALLDGGGIYAPDAQVVIENLSSELMTMVSSNVAGGDGGGLYLGGAYQDVVTGVAAAPTLVNANQAQRGGGVFVDGSQARLTYAFLRDNSASAEGGAVYVTGGGAIASTAAGLPPTVGGFPVLTFNSAARGASLYVADGAVALRSGRIGGHNVSAEVVAAAGDSVLLFHGVVFAGNVAPVLFEIAEGAALQLEHATLLENFIFGGGLVRWRGSDSEVDVISTVLDDATRFFASFESPAEPPTFACVVSHYATPFSLVPPGTDLSFVTIADPELVFAQGYLRHSSPAIDHCPALVAFDVDGEARSNDDPYHANAPGWTADAGADETNVAFADAFESGDRSAWSDAFP